VLIRGAADARSADLKKPLQVVEIVVFYSDSRWSNMYAALAKENLKMNFGNLTFSAAGIPYAEQFGEKSASAVPVHTFIKLMEKGKPSDLANFDPIYVFHNLGASYRNTDIGSFFATPQWVEVFLIEFYLHMYP
jgi:hypothetical protein